MNDKKFIKTKIRKSLKKLLNKQHASGQELSRINLLAEIVASILQGGESKVSKISENLNAGRRKLESVKKQVSRFLSNKHISAENQYLPFIEEVLLALSKSGELEIIIDGSIVGKGCMCLMFSLVYKGRAIPLIWKVVKKKKGHFKQSEHVNLLIKLKSIVPKNVKVTILGDGEFDGINWQEKIKFYSWQYVLRTAKNAILENSDGETYSPKQVAIEKGESLFIQDLQFGKEKYGPINLLFWHGKGYDEPLFLVTNIDDGYLAQSYYIKRFLIETFFRDIKSKGFNIQKSGLRNPEKLSRLLMCSCFAFILGLLAGVKARKSKLYDLVAGQVIKALSLFQLGLNFIRKLVDLRQWRAFSISYDILRNLE
jgi:hypothetical protein